MKIKPFLFFLLISLPSIGQMVNGKKLFPIEEGQKGFNRFFVYKRQLIESPLALQIPLLEAHDPEINRQFLIYKRQQKHIKWISGATAILSFYSLLNKHAVSDGFYWSVVGTSAVANLYFGSVSMKHFRKALNRYNELAADASKISLHVTPNSPTGPSVGINWAYKF